MVRHCEGQVMWVFNIPGVTPLCCPPWEVASQRAGQGETALQVCDKSVYLEACCSPVRWQHSSSLLYACQHAEAGMEAMCARQPDGKARGAACIACCSRPTCRYCLPQQSPGKQRLLQHPQQAPALAAGHTALPDPALSPAGPWLKARCCCCCPWCRCWCWWFAGCGEPQTWSWMGSDRCWTQHGRSRQRC